jgi:hypothetical protein
MKALLIVGASIALLALIQVRGWAQTRYVLKPDEEIFGTWVNEETTTSHFQALHFHKIVITADAFKDYLNVSDSVPVTEGTAETDAGWIDSKWTDSEGNTWYKAFHVFTTGPYKGNKIQELDKLSKSGTVWESVFSYVREFNANNYPTKIDPMSFTYSIFYRAEQ